MEQLIEKILHPRVIVPIAGALTGVAAMDDGSALIIIVGLVNFVAGIMQGRDN